MTAAVRAHAAGICKVAWIISDSLKDVDVANPSRTWHAFHTTFEGISSSPAALSACVRRHACACIVPALKHLKMMGLDADPAEWSSMPGSNCLVKLVHGQEMYDLDEEGEWKMMIELSGCQDQRLSSWIPAILGGYTSGKEFMVIIFSS